MHTAIVSSPWRLSSTGIIAQGQCIPSTGKFSTPGNSCRGAFHVKFLPEVRQVFYNKRYPSFISPCQDISMPGYIRHGIHEMQTGGNGLTSIFPR
jgi:hypothetical protein